MSHEDDPWTREPLSADALAEERALAQRFYLDVLGHEVAAFTCDECSFAPRCTLAFDAYNTDGDCLASK